MTEAPDHAVDARRSPGGELRRSPLDAEHAAAGATMTAFAGWSMPLRYTSDLAEHRAVRSAAGLFDLSHMGEIAVRGADAGAALDGALVGSLSTLDVGRARYTMLCQDDGGILDDLVVYRRARDDYLVVANAANTAVVLAELRHRCANPPSPLATSEDHWAITPGSSDVAGRVEVVDESAVTVLLAVQGPASAEVLAPLVEDPDERAALVALRAYAGTTAGIAAAEGIVPAFVARTGYTGEDGFELFVPSDHAPSLWCALLERGSASGLVPAGLACRDSLRLEAGMPLYGNELDRTTTPFEARLGRLVRFDKVHDDGAPRDFVGRTALAGRADMPPARLLVGLRGTGRRAARSGYPVLREPGGPVVGRVTSGAPSPTLGHPVALAYVTPEVCAEGTALVVDVRGRPEPVVVQKPPFYRRTARDVGADQSEESS